MTVLTSSRNKYLLLLFFCSLSFLISNAQRREERRQHISHDNRSRNGNYNRGPRFQQHPPARVNRSNDRSFHADRGRYAHNYHYPNRYHYNNRRPVYSAYNPSWRYRYMPARRTVVSSFPFAYQTINYGGCGYRYYNGAFYRPYNSAFIVAAPPIGISISILPAGYRRVYVNNYPYYYYNGTFYDQYENDYRVVAPPLGAIVESLPQGYETITIDGETYYSVDGVQYKPAVQENGEIWYEVIKAEG